MNGLGKPFRKNPKSRKNSKNQSEIAACEQKTTSEKPNFCSNTVFSLYFKIRAIKIHAAKPLAFSLHFLFRRDQNHYSNLTSEIMKMCEQILKKKTAPQYNSNSLNCKNQEKANNSPSYRCAAINHFHFFEPGSYASFSIPTWTGTPALHFTAIGLIPLTTDPYFI